MLLSSPILAQVMRFNAAGRFNVARLPPLFKSMRSPVALPAARRLCTEQIVSIDTSAMPRRRPEHEHVAYQVSGRARCNTCMHAACLSGISAKHSCMLVPFAGISAKHCCLLLGFAWLTSSTSRVCTRGGCRVRCAHVLAWAGGTECHPPTLVWGGRA